MKRRVVLAVAVLLGLGLVGLLAVMGMSHPRHGVTRQNAERVQVGMTRGEIERCLGGPAGDYSRGEALPVYGYKLLDGREWVGDDCAVHVWFDPDEKATKCAVVDVAQPDGGLWRRFLRRFGL
jgi:hypothetical protein